MTPKANSPAGGVMALLNTPWLVRAAQFGIAAIFILAGLAKLGDPKGFAEQIHNFRLVPVALENLVAMTLPWIEVVCGLALVANWHGRAASRMILVMMVVFTVAVAAAVARGLDIECGCFGTADASTVGYTKLLENCGMILMAWIATLSPRVQPAGATEPPGSLSQTGVGAES